MSADPSLSFSKALPHPLNWKLQLLLAHWLFHQARAFLVCLASWVTPEQQVQPLTASSSSQTALTSPWQTLLPCHCLSDSCDFKDVLQNGNAEEKILNLNTICKTSSPNTSANKWIQQCSFSIMGAICVLFSENNAFCKITLNRKCLCCHFWLLTASSQWDLPQHKTDLAVFADWGPTFPDTWNTALMEISVLRFLYLFFFFFMWDVLWVFPNQMFP